MSEYSMVNDNLLSTKVECDADTIKYLHGLLWTLEKMKGREYRSTDYKLVLGINLVKAIGEHPVIKVADLNKPIYFYGVEVKIDYKNVTNIQIFEDITNKIALDH